MTKMTMTRQDEFEFFAEPENQEPQGPARRRRRSKLPEIAKCEPADGLASPGAEGADSAHAHGA
jgi:hypothetical protein